MRLILRVTAVIFLSLTAIPIFADETEPSKEDSLLGWSITPGIGVRVVSLDVKRLSDGYTGRLTNDGSFSDPIYLSLNIESPSWMLSPKVGLSIRSISQTFRLSRQQVPSSTSTSGQDYVDVGTSVQGFYSYLGPTLFYRMVDATGDSRFGLGYGYWKAWFQGEIILDPNGAAASGMPSTSISGSTKGTPGPILFWQARGKRMLFEIAISQVVFSQPNYRFTLGELVMNVGYQFSF